ncbi:MAG: hypothetical protein GVY13_13450 [Alphaproteobacteria bacterium]|jgi:hypothetical protein|nr:hypothetical protein [Alphaproteobacteria bacterium]
MAEPTANEQFMLELINEARADPEAEAVRLGISLNKDLPPGTISPDPKQPLAFHPALIDAGREHSAWMLDTDIFSHTGAGGSSAGDRMAAAGYAMPMTFSWGENISWRGSTGSIDATEFIASQHDSLFRSEGHRENILLDSFKEIGIGQQLGLFTDDGRTYNASMVTQNFATLPDSDPFLTGVAYEDTDDNDFYTVGEGLGGLTIEAVRQLDGMVTSTQTMQAGGYRMDLPLGSYTVTVTGGGLTFDTYQVMIGGENVKLDPQPLETTAPKLTIAAVDAAHAEGDSGATDFTFTVGRSGDLSGTVTVDYMVTGADPEDFAGGSRPFGTVTLAPDDTETTVTIAVAGDTDEEPDESFTVTLSNPSGGAVITTASATGTIENDDQPAPLSPNLFGILVAGIPAQTVSSGTVARFIDASGDQVLIVEPSASLALQGTVGANIIVLPGDVGDFTISRDFADVTLAGPNDEGVSFVARTTAQTLVFDNGALDVRIEGDAVMAGDQAVIDVPVVLGASPDGAPGLPAQPASPPGTPNFFGIVVEETPAQLITGGTFARIIDAPGAQTFHTGAGASLALEGSSGANTISLQATAGDVEISRDVASVTLSGPNGETVTFTARTTPQTIVFQDGAQDVRIEGDQVLIGGQPVTENPEPVSPVFELLSAGELIDPSIPDSGDLLLV